MLTWCDLKCYLERPLDAGEGWFLFIGNKSFGNKSKLCQFFLVSFLIFHLLKGKDQTTLLLILQQVLTYFHLLFNNTMLFLCAYRRKKPTRYVGRTRGKLFECLQVIQMESLQVIQTSTTTCKRFMHGIKVSSRNLAFEIYSEYIYLCWRLWSLCFSVFC